MSTAAEKKGPRLQRPLGHGPGPQESSRGSQKKPQQVSVGAKSILWVRRGMNPPNAGAVFADLCEDSVTLRRRQNGRARASLSERLSAWRRVSEQRRVSHALALKRCRYSAKIKRRSARRQPVQGRRAYFVFEMYRRTQRSNISEERASCCNSATRPQAIAFQSLLSSRPLSRPK